MSDANPKPDPAPSNSGSPIDPKVPSVPDAAASTAADAPTKPKRPGRWKRRFLIATPIVILLYTLGGFFLVPWIIKSQVIPRVSKEINGDVALREARCNPYQFRLTLDGLAVSDPAGTQLLAVEQFDANFQLVQTIFNSGYHFKFVHITEPFVDALLEQDGSFNLAKLLPTSTGPSEPSEPLERIPRLVIADFKVVDAELRFRDESVPTPFESRVTDGDVLLADLDLRESHENPLTITLVTDADETITVEGSFFADPLTAAGEVIIEDIDLYRYMPYLEGLTPAQITRGKLSVTLGYGFAPAADARRAEAEVRSVRLNDILVEHEGKPIVELPEVALNDLTSDASAQTARLASVVVTGPHLYVDRNAEGVFNFMKLLPAEVQSTELIDDVVEIAEDIGEAAADQDQTHDQIVQIPYPLERLMAGVEKLIQDALGPWEVLVEAVEIHEGALTYADAFLDEPVAARITNLQVMAGPSSSEANFHTPFEISLNVKDGDDADAGSIAVSGDVQPLALAAQVQVTIADLAAAPFAPYLPTDIADPLPPIKLTDGRLSISGDASGLMNDNGAIEATWEGSIATDDLAVANHGSGSSMLELSRLELAGPASATIPSGGLPEAQWEGTLTLSGLAIDEPEGVLPTGPVAVAMDDFAVDGSVSTSTNNDALDVHFAGGLTLAGLDAQASDLYAADAQVEQVVIRDIDFKLNDATLAVASAEITNPNLMAEFLVLGPVPGAETETESEPESEPASDSDTDRSEAPSDNAESNESNQEEVDDESGFVITLAELTINGGRVTINDTATDPSAVIIADDFDIAIQNFTTTGESAADIDAKLNFMEAGRVELLGSLNAMADVPEADVTLAVDTAPLIGFSPYTGRLLGYMVDSGRMKLDIPVVIDQGQIDGTLGFRFEDFYLGDKVPSTEAPGLPFPLGLNLLRDPSGVIESEVEFSGSLDDPQFRIGKAVWSAFINLLVKAITAPFQFLAAAFGGDPDTDYSGATFIAGTTEFADGEADKLAVIARGLSGKAGIAVNVRGTFDLETDTAGLADAVLREQMLERLQQDDAKVTELDEAGFRAATLLLFAERLPDAELDFTPRNPTDDTIPPDHAPDLDGEPGGEIPETLIPVQRMAEMLRDTVEVNPERLRELALARAQETARRLVEEHGLSTDRVNAIVGEGEEAQSETPGQAGVLFEAE